MSELNLSTLSIPSFRITDIIDILLVALLIYVVMIWIKETRAWSLFKGIVVIFIISIFSYQLHFYTVSWIIEKTLSVGIIALIVLFQPEFRKGLEQIGKGNIVTNIFNNDEEGKILQKTVKEVVTAAYKMAKVRTGALILLEQDVPLGDLEMTGIPIDAIVSSQLLINIFENKTPLHDGAVIIRNNRVAAATCILPLTQTEIGLDLGTRHRAAVGASEESDAYIIVVSEETGGVSVAHGGKLYRGLSESEVTKMISKGVKPTHKGIKLWKGRKNNAKKNK
ncbi:MAG: TIGR00159 family protein [Clostridiales bacterium]|nr:TIGR00159 family protein [Clostridiales bacterium]